MPYFLKVCNKNIITVQQIILILIPSKIDKTIFVESWKISLNVVFNDVLSDDKTDLKKA